jgi:hypothetical protein
MGRKAMTASFEARRRRLAPQDDAEPVARPPDGQITDTPCPAPSEKIFLFSFYPNHFPNRGIPSHFEGRIAIVTDVVRDAVDARSALTKALVLADGKAVWS